MVLSVMRMDLLSCTMDDWLEVGVLELVVVADVDVTVTESVEGDVLVSVTMPLATNLVASAGLY